MSITVKIKTNYLVIPGITLITIFLSGFYTWSGMPWYRTLVLPSIIMPEDWVFRVVWDIIYACTTAAAVLVFNRFEKNFEFYVIMALFGLNALLNMYWSYLFFYNHRIDASLLCALFLEFTTVALLVLIGRSSPTISLLLLPYAIWNVFSIVLNAMIWQLN